MGQSRLLFSLFQSLYHVPIQIDKSVDGVLKSRTRGSRMEGAHKSTELRLYPITILFTHLHVTYRDVTPFIIAIH